MSDSNIKSPDLFLIFNRPETTEQVFSSISEAKPTKLYIAADGPRSGNLDDVKNCFLAREKVKNVDWSCEVKTLFRDNNLGCKQAVSSAISWFFSQESEGIILEDDTLPNNDFFTFCSVLLEKYRNDTRIFTISGDNFQDTKRSEYSYYFSKYFHCWGWATWKRVWDQYDAAMADWPEFRDKGGLKSISHDDKSFERYWKNNFNDCFHGKIDTWDHQMTFLCWSQAGLNCIPENNLVSNIGFGYDGTHTKDVTSKSSFLKTYNLEKPLKHPEMVYANFLADKYSQITHHGITRPWLMKQFVKQLFNG